MPAPYRSILLFGPPGVGKGTQGKLLGSIPGLHHLATGDVFRALDRHSPLGKKFIEYSSQGLLVPDDLTIEVWQRHVDDLIDHGRYDPGRDLLVLDGMPRSVAQAEAMHGRIDVRAIVQLQAADLDIVVERMKRRAEQQGRHDDADEDVIRRRLDVYEAETAPVLGCYDAGLVSRIDALQVPIEVLRHVLEVVAPICTKEFGNPLG